MKLEYQLDLTFDNADEFFIMLTRNNKIDDLLIQNSHIDRVTTDAVEQLLGQRINLAAVESADYWSDKHEMEKEMESLCY